MGWSLPELFSLPKDEFDIWYEHISDYGTGELAAGKDKSKNKDKGPNQTIEEKSRSFVRSKVLDIAARNKNNAST